MHATTEFQDERAQRRQMRRLKRRVRLIGPFLGIPLLLATLSLSVDLIEYQPVTPSRERLSDVPIRRLPASSPNQAASATSGLISDADREALIRTAPDPALEVRDDAKQFDVTLPAAPLRPPTPPYVLQHP